MGDKNVKCHVGCEDPASWCPNGMWLTRDAAVKRLGLPSSSALKIITNVGAPHIHWELGSKVGEKLPPLGINVFTL